MTAMAELTKSAKVVSSAAWLDALARRRDRFTMGVSGYLKVSESWGFENRVLHDHLMYFLTESGFDAEAEGRSWNGGSETVQ